MPNYKLVLFDLDGTLTKSDPGVLRCVRETLAEMKFPELPPETLRKFIGPPLYQSMQEYCGMSMEEAQKAVELYREVYNTKGIYENSVYEGIFELLKDLHKQKIQVGVATSKPIGAARDVLGYFGLKEHLDVICGADEDEKRKTKTDVMREAIELAGVLPSETVMIGDTKFDAYGASQAGTEFIGALYGYGTREEMEECGANTFADTVEKLRGMLI